MRIPRIFTPTIDLNNNFLLDANASNHVGRVLRMNVGQNIELFNGDGFNYLTEILEVTRKQVLVKVINTSKNSAESPLKIHLGQVISRGDRMEFTIQKSVELGVCEITPLISERCGVKLNADRLDKKIQQWQKIVISACEQSGRSFIPKINPVIKLDEWIEQKTDELKINLHPRAKYSISTLPKPKNNKIRLLIGSEGGLSKNEIDKTTQFEFMEILLGARVLRTETASLTAISCLQARFGDLG